jgi:acyl-[acyl-carrier-protein]-phospholipid O-acyltransferase / long-chain-fatty-acid--[acyl-carrier-protein] ligase
MSQEKPVSLKHLKIIGQEHLPEGGGFMLLASQLSYHDLLRLELLLGERQIVYLVEQGAALHPPMRAHLDKEAVQAIEFSPLTTDPASYRQAVSEEIQKGKVLVYLPAQAAVINAPMSTVPGAKLEFLLKAGVPVLPIYIQRSLELALDIEPRYHEGDAIFAIGSLLRGTAEVNLAAYQESLLSLAEQCFSAHPALNMHLAYALLLGLKKHGGKNKIIDGKDEKEMGYDKVLAIAIALSKEIRSETKKKRVGIVLPPGLGGLIANVAVLLAGKVPVNLNFTAGRAAIEHGIKAGDMDRFITADIFVRKVQAFPWPPSKQLILIERALPKMKIKIGLWLVLSKLLPASLLATILGIPKKGGQEEALLLFTSGSSGTPKGVVLSHRNMIANVIQFGSRLGMVEGDSILGSLPLFHSFGCTVTLWYPIIGGVNLVTYPSPIETKKLAELIEKYRVSLMIATPTFLRGYLRGVNKEALTSIKLCVTGAEKLPATVSDAFEAKFGKRVYEGYGLTETSPVSNVNLPNPLPLGNESDGYVWIPSHRQGSVGQMVPGLSVRITHPETFEPQSIHSSGMIWFKGANIFEGYLHDEKRTTEVKDKDGWFRTGDMGRMDMDGFLYIEGRLSRFSKIAGEMVPHETVEEALVKAMGLENESSRKIAIVGVPDPDKGEALILLTAIPGGPEQQEILDLRYRLLEKGMPPLWIPKKMVRVSDIPILSSGKLDVQSCEKIARAAVS